MEAAKCAVGGTLVCVRAGKGIQQVRGVCSVGFGRFSQIWVCLVDFRKSFGSSVLHHGGEACVDTTATIT